MPSTVNGIGTHYYGKKNIQRRPGTCRSCGRNVELTSYDTRLWFVVVFVPVIPLGRKRILDDCPSCRRHYVMELDKWETARQLEVSGAMEKFRANPTPEDAIAAHQQLINFHQHVQASEFRRMMCEKYADNAKVHAYLGEALAHLGLFREADEAFGRALSLRADLPEARVGVARGHLRAQRLDEARALLDFLEKPGAGQLYPLEPIETLAIAYQKAGRHLAALELLKFLQNELPALTEHQGFRALVKKSEQGLNLKVSQLPKLPFSFKRLFSRSEKIPTSGPQLTWRSLLVVGIIVALVGLAFVIANEYIRRHRTVHIVNTFAQPATVSITDGGELKNIRGVLSMNLCEGRHHARIAGPVTEEFDFEIHSTYFSRWFSNPAWVLNVGGAAVLIKRDVVYSRNPRPPGVSLRFGKSFEYFSGITHPFCALPESLQMKSYEERTLVELQLYRGEGLALFGHLMNRNQPDEALVFSESWLPAHPDDAQVLRAYGTIAIQRGQQRRADDFYRRSLSFRPVRIEWHRAYQELHDTATGHAALVAEYDALLRSAPDDSALLYLRGRLAGDRKTGRNYFERAVQADSKNAYPVFAIGYDYMIAGNWGEARTRFARATELRPGDASFEHWLLLARFGVGEIKTIEAEIRQRLARNPEDFAATSQLIDVLAAQNLTDEALRVASGFTRAAGANYGSQLAEITAGLRAQALYAAGNFAELEKINGLPASATRRFVAEALIEQGRVTEGEKMLESQENSPGKLVDALALTVAFLQAGDKAAAEKWQRQAHHLLAAGNMDSVQAAMFLNSRTMPTLAEAQALMLPLKTKAVLLAAMIKLHPEARAEFAPLVHNLNVVERTFPFHLVRRITTTAP
ncbi:MAG: hypothetical protein NTZ16_11605 [Verrucomicrobia bacterium]|nr:hypothetical protein [Verrucomicrobiota bacterium]